MKKLLRIATLFSIILLSSSVYGLTRHEFIDMHEARIIERCEDENITWEPFRNNEMAVLMLKIPWRYECGLLQFYALRKNVQHMMNMSNMDDDKDAWKAFENIMEENYIEEFDTYDFVAANLAYEKWLEDQDK